MVPKRLAELTPQMGRHSWADDVERSVAWLHQGGDGVVGADLHDGATRHQGDLIGWNEGPQPGARSSRGRDVNAPVVFALFAGDPAVGAERRRGGGRWGGQLDQGVADQDDRNDDSGDGHARSLRCSIVHVST